VEKIGAELEDAADPAMTVDLEAQTIVTPAGTRFAFEIDAERRHALLEGLDEIGLTLKLDERIRAFQKRDRGERPWIYRSEETENMARVLILAGDGIGPEVVAEVRRVVEWFVANRELRIDLREEAFGIAAWKQHGNLMREETWQEILAADAILFGATGSPEYENRRRRARSTSSCAFAATSIYSPICGRCALSRRWPEIRRCGPR
jgi:Isocitrate/isopropylmalate dehydrogenase